MVAVISNHALQGVSPMTSTGDKRLGGYSIKQWSPRSAPSGFSIWDEELRECMRTSVPQIPKAVLLGPPTPEQLVLDNPKATDEQIEERLHERMVLFQQYNTALWDLARPSVSLLGAYDFAPLDGEAPKAPAGAVKC